MKHDLVLMAKSKKRRGYCVAGIDCNTGDWIRLNIQGRESVPRYMLRFADDTEPDLLDVISVDIFDKDDTEPFQPENYFCSLDNLERSGADYLHIVERRLSKDRMNRAVFYNHENSVDYKWLCESCEKYYSLMLVDPINLVFRENESGKINASFEYGGNYYRNIRVTDLEFEASWKMDGHRSRTGACDNYVLVLSMGLPYKHDDEPEEEKCWKLVAAVIDKSKLGAVEKNENNSPPANGHESAEHSELIGKRIKHKSSGLGTIVRYETKNGNEYILVRFDWMEDTDKDKKYNYPDSIGRYLLFADETDEKGTPPVPAEQEADPEEKSNDIPCKLLKRYFGYDSFREGQRRAITSILQGRDTLAIMPTGAGKSICYQIPAMMMDGITIVISPLIALMQDQVKGLEDAGIPAAYINSSLSNQEINDIMYYAVRGKYKILYVAPERLENYMFISAVKRMKISMVAVDEAHCISQWGQDFRPSYLKIIQFIRQLPARPCVSAFTATATGEVKNDIICILNLRDPEIIVTGFDRPNLFYRVEQIRNKNAFIDNYIRNHEGDSGIIYCATRKNVENLYHFLLERGFPVTRYHAGIDNETRKKNQEDFTHERANIIVATNAFGMGIDKSNVRFVIHYNMTQSMEYYYQEAGRAGRDSAAAECILLFSPQDLVINKFILDNKEFPELDPEETQFARMRDRKRLRDMEIYCTSGECLRNYIRRYFGEEVSEPCGNCGNCQKEFEELDMTVAARAVVNCVWEARGRYGAGIIAGTLKGANRARLRETGTINYKSYGKLSDLSEDIIRKLILKMIESGYLYRTNDQYQMIQLGNIEPLKDDSIRVTLKVLKTPAPADGSRKITKKYTDALTSTGFRLLNRLKNLRTEIARSSNLPPYVVFTDKALIEMCIHVPKNEAEFLQISGVGEHKLAKYGDAFLTEIHAFMEENPDADTFVTDNESKESISPGFATDSKSEAKVNKKPSSAGSSWTEEEDNRLKQEFEMGNKISEIAKAHERTYGAIRSRLKKQGLLD